MTGVPREITSGHDPLDLASIRQELVTHANDHTVHGIPELMTADLLAESKTGIWTVAATDSFSGADGSPMGTTETGGFTWQNPVFQRIGGKLKHPTGVFGATGIDTTAADGQVEGDLAPLGGEASLIFRGTSGSFASYMLL